MPNINAIINFYESVSKNQLSYNRPFDEIIAKKTDDETYRTGEFSLVSDINVLGTSNPEEKEKNILYKKGGKLNFIIRLTKCDRDVQKRFFCDLDSFTLSIDELREKDRVDLACFDFVNYSRITTIPSISLKKPGYYVIKMLVKDESDVEKNFCVQFIKRLTVRFSCE